MITRRRAVVAGAALLAGRWQADPDTMAYDAIRTMQLQRFDGRQWLPLGDSVRG